VRGLWWHLVACAREGKKGRQAHHRRASLCMCEMALCTYIDGMTRVERKSGV
jgi:hypothetical protein